MTFVRRACVRWCLLLFLLSVHVPSFRYSLLMNRGVIVCHCGLRINTEVARYSWNKMLLFGVHNILLLLCYALITAVRSLKFATPYHCLHCYPDYQQDALTLEDVRKSIGRGMDEHERQCENTAVFTTMHSMNIDNLLMTCEVGEHRNTANSKS